MAAAEVTGFVVKVTGTGAETCNCKSTTTRFTDTHIDLVIDPADAGDETKHVVVEVNPRLRAKMKSQGINWSSTQLRKTLLNKWVRFRGWLFFDQIHADEAENTTPGRAKNWRATAVGTPSGYQYRITAWSAKVGAPSQRIWG